MHNWFSASTFRLHSRTRPTAQQTALPPQSPAPLRFDSLRREPPSYSSLVVSRDATNHASHEESTHVTVKNNAPDSPVTLQSLILPVDRALAIRDNNTLRAGDVSDFMRSVQKEMERGKWHGVYNADNEVCKQLDTIAELFRAAGYLFTSSIKIHMNNGTRYEIGWKISVLPLIS